MCIQFKIFMIVINQTLSTNSTDDKVALMHSYGIGYHDRCSTLWVTKITLEDRPAHLFEFLVAEGPVIEMDAAWRHAAIRLRGELGDRLLTLVVRDIHLEVIRRPTFQGACGLAVRH